MLPLLELSRGFCGSQRPAQTSSVAQGPHVALCSSCQALSAGSGHTHNSHQHAPRGSSQTPGGSPPSQGSALSSLQPRSYCRHPRRSLCLFPCPPPGSPQNGAPSPHQRTAAHWTRPRRAGGEQGWPERVRTSCAEPGLRRGHCGLRVPVSPGTSSPARGWHPAFREREARSGLPVCGLLHGRRTRTHCARRGGCGSFRSVQGGPPGLDLSFPQPGGSGPGGQARRGQRTAKVPRALGAWLWRAPRSPGPHPSRGACLPRTTQGLGCSRPPPGLQSPVASCSHGCSPEKKPHVAQS